MRITTVLTVGTELLEGAEIYGAFVHSDRKLDPNGFTETEHIEESISILAVDQEAQTVTISVHHYEDESDLDGQFDGSLGTSAFSSWGLSLQLVAPGEDGELDFEDGEAVLSIPVPELGLNLVGVGFGD